MKIRPHTDPCPTACQFPGRWVRTRRERGVTLVELVIVMVVAGLLAVIGNEVYAGYVEEARQRTIIGDIKKLEVQLERFRTENGRLPDSLAELGVPATDPYGNPYEYLNIEDGGPGIRGRVRKDRNLVPINSDFDLYSRGRDGDTRPPLTVPVSHDDVLRGGNGGYVGLASSF